MKRLLIVLVILLGAGAHSQREAMAGEGQAEGARPNTEEDAVRAWLQANAIRLDTVEAGRGSADLQPLRRAVGNARIVALGWIARILSAEAPAPRVSRERNGLHGLCYRGHHARSI